VTLESRHLDSTRLVWGTQLLAALLSLWFSLPLRSAAELGFYDSDYNQLVTFLDSDRSIASHFFSDEPLFNVYHAVRYRLFGDHPLPHHVFQGLLLAANSTLAFALVWRLAANRLLPFLFLLLFLTYPNRGQAYFWPGAAYVPMLFCLLLALHFCWSWLRGGRRWLFTAGWLTFSAAVFTHEAACGFVAILAAFWLLERWPAVRWREGLRFLAPFAGTTAAYLLIRQTRWFGFGDPGFSQMRTLQPQRVWPQLGYSLQAHFGHVFWADVTPAIREGASTHSMIPALAGMLAALLFAVWLVKGSGPGFWQRAEGMLLWPVGLGGAVVYTTSEHPLDLILILRVALHAVVLLALAAAVKIRFFPAPAGAGLPKLAALGAAWFVAAYSPAYILYLAPRHSYIPSFGLCLALAAALAWPAACAVDDRRRRLLEGASLGLAALIAVAFYAASLGERGRWVWAAHFIGAVKQEMLQIRPTLPPDTRVVILDLPAPPPGVPLLAGYALEAALRHWYRNPQILANVEFTPRRQDFLLPYINLPQPYNRLLLFYHDHAKLRPVPALVFENGSEIPLGTALAPAPQTTPGSPLLVVTGEPVQ
jgi:hypothetical protein